ncbi:MAG: HipA family kinase [Flexibacteraceae bacterium]
MEIITGLRFKNIVKSGSQKAWEIDGLDQYGNENTWCVKLYSPINHNQSTINDIICSTLARELEVSTPDFGMLRMTSEFKELLPNDQITRFDKLRQDYLFCTKWINDATIINPISELKKIANYELESVYAFDFLVQNKDRRFEKPNLLISNAECFIIDHEMTFVAAHLSFPRNEISIPKNHLLMEYLKHNSLTSFDTFQEVFKHFKVSAMENLPQEIEAVGYDLDYSYIVLTYLEEVSTNSQLFIKKLKASLL